MRVLVVTNSLDPRYGGPTFSAANSAIALAEQGIKVTYVAPTDAKTCADGNEVTRMLAAAGVDVRAFVIARTLGRIAERWAVSFTLLGWLLRQARTYDRVIVRSPWAAASLFVAALPRRKSQAILLAPHESLTHFDMYRTGGRLKVLTKRLLGRYLLSRLDAVVFSSDLEREDCYFAIEKERAYVIHHPVMRDDAVAPVPKATDPQCVVFGYFGRFHAKKNIHLVVQALLGLSDRVRLHIAGSGELKITLRELAAQLGVDDRIRWWGFVNIAERNAYFSSCDVLVMPSAYECFGMAHAESICCSVPVITTSATGISSVVAAYGCGSLVEPNVAAVTEAMQRYSTDPATLDAAKAACALAATAQFSFSAHGHKLAALLRSVGNTMTTESAKRA